MSIGKRAVRFALAASALVSSPVLAQNRFAVWENGDVVYVGPEDPRARSAFPAAQEKAPLVVVTEGWGESAQPIFVEERTAMSARPQSAFDAVPMSFVSTRSRTTRVERYIDPALAELLRGTPP